MNRDPASLEATVLAIKEARNAVEEARFELCKMMGRESLHKLPSEKRRVKITLVDEVRLRVWAQGPVVAGWLEVSALEDLPAAEKYHGAGIGGGVQAGIVQELDGVDQRGGPA